MSKPLFDQIKSDLSAPANLNSFEEVKERILIVDDEEPVRSLFVACLSEHYECHQADSTQEALICLAETDFALVISDVIMPGLSGIELLRKIIEKYPYIAVIMTSGVDRPQRSLDAVRLGAFDYLIKPCDLAVMELTVERALERRTLMLNTRQYKLDLEARNAELVRGKAELERLQAQIIHSEKMASIGQLAAGIAHELNNPVGFIYGNMDILNQSLTDLTELLNFYDNAEMTEAVAVGAMQIKERIDYQATLEDLSLIVTDCRDGATRIRDIVQNLRTFSRLDEAEFKKTDIHEGINSTIRLLSLYYGSDKITLVREYGDLPLVDSFSGQLNQVWMNLLVNAAQAVSNTGGEVRITTQVVEDAVAISIQDNGYGIPPEHLNRIFDPFYTTKAVGEGTGLGLSISFGIIKRHGGKINVESQLDVGTEFTITLPIDIKTASTDEV